jgi:twitching motility protein PilU
MESNTAPVKEAPTPKTAIDPKIAATGPQAALAPGAVMPASALGAAADPLGGGHPTLNTKPLFKLMVEKKASDLFFTSNAPIKIKIEGQILPVNKQILTPETVRQTAFALMSPEQREHFIQEYELDFAISEPGLGRFRVNVFMQRGFPAMVLRYITADMPRIESLGLPDVMTDLVLLRRGLILMVGSTGSGKSTSLAAMINYRNENASDHIVTIEDPIEFLHTNKRSIVNQREVGIDTKSYSRALRGVVRAAPDVILIGEIRDRESMEAAINLAGTGHLVLATLHANNCAESLDRIINMFPREQHSQIFLDMSQYLRAILAQRLVMGRDGKRVAAVEVMINTPHISELIKKGDVMGIKEAITSSGERGIQSFDHSLRDLVKSGRIELEEALNAADSRANL